MGSVVIFRETVTGNLFEMGLEHGSKTVEEKKMKCMKCLKCSEDSN